MKSPSLNRFYLKINRAILLAQSYTEDKDLSFIIKSCRLKPFPLFFQDEKYNLILYKKWFDEFGNSLNIIKNKRIKIINGDLLLRSKPIICTDIYYGLAIEKILKLSKILHLVIGINEDTQDHYFMITFLGIDNYLRSYVYDNSIWEQISPLCLGMKRLKNICRHTDIKYFHELSNKENYMTPCASTTEWISSVYPSEDFLLSLKKRHDVDFSFLKTD